MSSEEQNHAAEAPGGTSTEEPKVNGTNVEGQVPFTPMLTAQQEQQEHPEGEEIRRQVEYYFSDENLPSDAHLLGKCGGAENKPVSVKHICGFKKMRGYRPHTAVIASLKKSTFLEIVDGKLIRRKVPLSIKPSVEPEATVPVKKEDQPWMTKGMLKATGFEEYWTDAPVTPEVHEEELDLYDSSLPFAERIETAIQRYRAKRKWHQEVANIFAKWMKYGGVDSGPKQFSGGLDVKYLEDRSTAEIGTLTSIYYVSESKGDEEKWAVDFEGIAKGFFSSQVPTFLDCTTEKQVKACTNVPRNFYNYILHHDVCPEHRAQIFAARAICDQAETELLAVRKLASLLPGDCNTACSTLFGGYYAGIDKKARQIVMAGIAAYGTDEQFAQAEAAKGALKTVAEELVGLEVVEILHADAETRAYYEGELAGTGLRTLGAILVRRWTASTFASSDLPLLSTSLTPHTSPSETVRILIESPLLAHLTPGLKIEATLRTLDIGLHFLDSVTNVYCSFYTYLPNELGRKWREPGPPRQARKGEGVRREEEEGGDDAH
ncbi:hypothetical protein B0A49_09908 [Cryomyces minteri]|uniref:HTH La-type RNA-binding domain-containing protein n=1 Tax=Cryomyces minteri TaxID=331657 RepID=A0A4U0WJB5_9PEZI|nr:hypothetical protein B0A49_09908 [Cryomyces minteri]